MIWGARRSDKIAERALETGVNYFDTASSYGDRIPRSWSDSRRCATPQEAVACSGRSGFSSAEFERLETLYQTGFGT